MHTETQEKQDGSPSKVSSEFYEIEFQCGPIKEVGVNGTTIEAVIDVLISRLDGFQCGPFKCDENALAIAHLKNAKCELLTRTRRRVAAGVEGLNKPH